MQRFSSTSAMDDGVPMLCAEACIDLRWHEKTLNHDPFQFQSLFQDSHHRLIRDDSPFPPPPWRPALRTPSPAASHHVRRHAAGWKCRCRSHPCQLTSEQHETHSTLCLSHGWTFISHYVLPVVLPVHVAACPYVRHVLIPPCDPASPIR